MQQIKKLQSIKQTILNRNPFRRLCNSSQQTNDEAAKMQSNCTTTAATDSERIRDSSSSVPADIVQQQQQQIFFAYYYGNTILSLDSDLSGSVSNCIGKIIESSASKKKSTVKVKRVVIQISLRGFRILDCETSACLVDAPIYRISYFTLSQTHKNVYAFVYQNVNSKLFECHVFDCKSKQNVNRR
jgi:hypothetical protein